MGFYLFRTPKPRTFEHVPIYYDESKERLKQMQRQADVEAGKLSSDKYVPNIKGKFRKNWHNTYTSSARNEKRKSNLRLVAIIAVLFFIAWLILNSDFSILNVFWEK
ncbi:hypothetical protein ACE01N_17540 [Saccharicrinis sp. FJH2]|uniref:hypothetical protein n=1 Tax=Saccharicrinis sp. FJH65 TaxID=3344659 RepID=UPI0035F29775